MYIITGKITENGRDKAYSVFGVDEQRTCLLTRKQVKNLVYNTHSVFGMDLVNSVTSSTYAYKKSKPYLWRRLPELNGKGEVEAEENKDIQIMVGTNGFKEIKSFVTVKPTGEISVYTEAEIKEEISKGNIIGAVMASNDKVINYVRNELADQWLLNLGYKRDENMRWKFISKEEGEKEKKLAEENLIKQRAESIKQRGLTAFREDGSIKRVRG